MRPEEAQRPRLEVFIITFGKMKNHSLSPDPNLLPPREKELLTFPKIRGIEGLG
ncbi:MAG: hypothetical protein ACI8PD_002335 [Nitrospinales bacterium]|jgi:hypothetical protein